MAPSTATSATITSAGSLVVQMIKVMNAFQTDKQMQNQRPMEMIANSNSEKSSCWKKKGKNSIVKVNEPFEKFDQRFVDGRRARKVNVIDQAENAAKIARVVRNLKNQDWCVKIQVHSQMHKGSNQPHPCSSLPRDFDFTIIQLF